MLDDDFVQAWTNGVVQQCKDAVLRRRYPRILAYVGDLPEKLVSTAPLNVRSTAAHECSQISCPLDSLESWGVFRAPVA